MSPPPCPDHPPARLCPLAGLQTQMQALRNHQLPLHNLPSQPSSLPPHLVARRRGDPGLWHLQGTFFPWSPGKKKCPDHGVKQIPSSTRRTHWPSVPALVTRFNGWPVKPTAPIPDTDWETWGSAVPSTCLHPALCVALVAAVSVNNPINCEQTPNFCSSAPKLSFQTFISASILTITHNHLNQQIWFLTAVMKTLSQLS